MIHEANTTEWQVGDIVVHDVDSKDHKMLMVIIGEKMEGTTRILRTQYLNPMEIVPNCIKRAYIGKEIPKRKISRYYNIWLNEIKYLHDPAIFGIEITEADRELAQMKAIKGELK